MIFRRLPVLHIYTELPIDVKNLAEQVKTKFGGKEESTNLAIFYDVRYHKSFKTERSVFEKLPNLNTFVCEPSTEAGQVVQVSML